MGVVEQLLRVDAVEDDQHGLQQVTRALGVDAESVTAQLRRHQGSDVNRGQVVDHEGFVFTREFAC